MKITAKAMWELYDKELEAMMSAQLPRDITYHAGRMNAYSNIASMAFDQHDECPECSREIRASICTCKEAEVV